jgi:hypothetical protein
MSVFVINSSIFGRLLDSNIFVVLYLILFHFKKFFNCLLIVLFDIYEVESIALIES